MKSLYDSTSTVLRIERSGDPQVGQSYSLSCIITESHYTSLTWSNSEGDVLASDSSGSLSSLELEFEALDLFHVGNYTCTVNLSNGDSRHLTEQIIATGKDSSHIYT